MNLRTTALAGILLALVIPLAGCGAGDDANAGASTEEVLGRAKTLFDESASVHLVLSTDSVPTSGDAVLGADGVLTQQPAFEGQVTVVLNGFNVDVPVISVGAKVYAKILSPNYAPIDPSDYGAPDPADFADLERGVSALLLKLEDPKQSGKKRQGDQVLTTYSGSLAGSLVSPIIPSASDDGTYRTEIGIDSDGRLATLTVTGDFFTASGDVTYDLRFDAYGKNVTISAP
ncbi:MAG: LppX_LprAFG lipoprotein [Propionibacteriales bacterium]|nr:LppX_LprAFG lipoprotein [Propionibacteriales bacterium]